MASKKHKKLLIANRGEIAVRIIRAAREAGLRTVAVNSEADRQALHVRLADEAVELGPPEATQSYLNRARLLEAARACGADAVHPGYGFLAENADFAEDCATAGLTFVGPSAQAIRQMGSKIVSKEIAARAGVPVIPSHHTGEGTHLSREAFQAAERLGYPILVKASAGGGGKGMRIVNNPADLHLALEAGAREAQQAFDDATLLLEKYLARPRHIEIQILGDHFGNRVHLFERECSIQRRHQKIIEETPSPAVTPALREHLADAALRLAAAVDYSNAGTVEFLLDADGRFYFLEMNTRLQVEHPITELVTGVDLVQQQLRLAQGERLNLTQEQLVQRGHAIECRLYAEDPAHDFMPATGRIAVLREPHGPGWRIDSGLALHTEVTPYYDPILAKLVTYGFSRQEATARMQSLLGEYTVLGVTTNRQFLLEVLGSEAFADADTDTTFLERYFPAWAPDRSIPDEIIAIATLGEWLQRCGQPARTPASAAHSSTDDAFITPWRRRDGWRIGGSK
ncbi:Acetyl-/propionyl-coenzyme A carboxylase alpha chain [Candidatus Entotheonellaceae bacterium PAL068K]